MAPPLQRLKSFRVAVARNHDQGHATSFTVEENEIFCQDAGDGWA